MASPDISANRLCLQLSTGSVIIECLSDIAPGHVQRIRELAAAGFYDGLSIHRADRRMVQTGDPAGTGTGGTGRTLRAEFSEQSHTRGAVSMARMPDDEHSADCQFFIVRSDQPGFDGRFTVWGRVVEGMDLIDAIPDGTQEREFNIGGQALKAGGYVAENPVRVVFFRPEPGC